MIMRSSRCCLVSPSRFSRVSHAYSLYSEEIATFGESDYNQKDSEGFINLYGLPIKVQAMVDAKNKK